MLILAAGGAQAEGFAASGPLFFRIDSSRSNIILFLTNATRYIEKYSNSTLYYTVTEAHLEQLEEQEQMIKKQLDTETKIQV